MSLTTETYYNRDISWLRFNHRVLQEANDTGNPLYERIKFLAIFSSNLDEFFKVRVSAIRQIKELDKSLRKKLITKPNKLLKKIKKEVDIQQEAFGEIFRNQIVPELKQEGIELISWKQFSENQKKLAAEYYQLELKNKLTLQLKKNEKEAIFIENEELYLAREVDKKLVVYKIPEDVPRFFVFPEENNTFCITFIDDILKYNLSKTTKDAQDDFYAIKVSRDAELYIDNEYSGNLLDKIKNSLGNRNTGQVTRMLIDQKAPKSLLNLLKKKLTVNETDIVFGGAYHNFKDFFGFPNPTSKNLTQEAFPPVLQKELTAFDSMFDAISKKDRLLYFPYESFEHVLQLLEEAALDQSVTKIKITLYRVAKESRLTNALMNASKNGKQVTVFIEAKARFDEQNNIKWGKVLEEHGAKVIYSYPGIKVHSKIMCIERWEADVPKYYGYIGTGNFNEKTAKLYTDFGLMTAEKKITSELLQVFQVLERDIIIPKSKKLLISPFTSRNKFLELIENEITNAKEGKEAYIILKLNSIQDEKMINALYKASNAGVKIRLLVRGICCLVPGIEGQSENITIISIVDRFLEHARVYVFGNGGKEKMYLGSADWMTRNLDHRIEVITPILDKDIKKRLKNYLNLQLEDDSKARIIDKNQKNEYFSKGSKTKGSQEKTYLGIVQKNS